MVMSHATRFGAGDGATSDYEFEFLTCDLGAEGSHREAAGIRGDRTVYETSVVDGVEAIGGGVSMEVRPDDLDEWVPRILGAGGVVGATVPEFVCNVELSAESLLYSGCKVNEAVFSASSTQNLQLALDILGKTESTQAFPSISGTLSVLQPYVLHQAVVTVASSARSVDNLEIRIANNLVGDRYFNSQTRSEIPESGLDVSLSFDNPFSSSDTALYDIARAGVTGSLVFTNGAYSLTMTFANLKMPRGKQAVGGRNTALDKRLVLNAYRTVAAEAIVIANDSTP